MKESLAKWHAAYGLKPPYVADEYRALVTACRDYSDECVDGCQCAICDALADLDKERGGDE
ncbi:MAG: hypothetical protein ACYS1A_20280 [Planctomycetota bacterium]